MPRLLRSSALGLVAVALVTPVLAESVSGPPDWADGACSVYLNVNQPAPDELMPAAPPPTRARVIDAPAAPAATVERTDAAVKPAVHEQPSEPISEQRRRLAPPTARSSATSEASLSHEGPRDILPPARVLSFSSGTLFTMISALAIAVGAFLLFAWALRRSGSKSTIALPPEVVSVLGRVPLAARQVAELVRVGNKLVLVSLTPSGAEPLTEVTDPAEVDRILGLCQQYNPHSTTKAFEQVFRQLSHERAPGGFLGDESLPQSIASAASAYRAHREGTARG